MDAEERVVDRPEPVIISGFLNDYCLEALLPYQDDESVKPLIKAKKHELEATRLSASGEHSTAIREWAAGYKIAEWVLTPSLTARSMLERSCRAILANEPAHADARFSLIGLDMISGMISLDRALLEFDAIIRINPRDAAYFKMRSGLKVSLSTFPNETPLSCFLNDDVLRCFASVHVHLARALIDRYVSVIK